MFGDGGGLIVLVAARMRSDALAAMEDFHGGHRRPNFHQLPGQCLGHTVVVAVELDVIVDIDARRIPLVKFVPFRGQGSQGGPIDLGEQTGSASRALAKRPQV